MLTIMGSLLFKIVFLMATGFAARKKNMITGEMQKGLSALLLKIVMPFTILMSSQNEFTVESLEVLRATGMITVVYYGAGIPAMIFLAKRLRLPGDRQKMFVLTTVFSNCAFLGFPLMQELYGGIGLLAAVIYSMGYNIAIYAWGFPYVSNSGKMNLKSLFKNPSAVLPVISLILYFSQIRFPVFLTDAFSGISSMMVPLSMIVTGCSLVNSEIADIIKDRQVYLVTVMRMLVIPFAVWGITKAVGMNPEAIVYTTMLCAFPVASIPVIMGEEYGVAPDYAAKALVQSMLVMVVTIPLLAVFLSV